MTQDTNYDVKFWLEYEVMAFYQVILMSIIFLVLSTFLQPKLPDPKSLLKNYDYLELIVADAKEQRLIDFFVLETFPGVMYIF
jgi:hypothetical protein